MRAKLLLLNNVLMLLATTIPASSDEIQKMTVAELVEKCTTADPTSAAFCNGLAAGVLNQLQANGLFLNMQALRLSAISDDTRKILKSAGRLVAQSIPKWL